ncbi:hypothetical protein [Desulfonatronovibrio hydrogenovorans]|uniref:hypothetical protein n=1 Tax=Desulfonatronovibrio hydrogenovorans TaxID=53245 RepID=UPI00048F88CE|nr:hypothetical protein [Desulfonatronovibrio hydrogenovorans]
MTLQASRTFPNKMVPHPDTNLPVSRFFVAKVSVLCRRLVLLALIFLAGVYVSAPQPAQACPPGMIRTVLSWSDPSLKDFSYFIESYVTHEKYQHRFDNHQSRFYAVDFHSLDKQGRRASVLFEVLDVKYNSRFQERMDFTRAGNGNWQLMEPDGNIRDVFSYLPTWLYVVQTYLRPAAMVGLPLLLALLVVLRVRRKRGSLTGKESVAGG